MFFNCVWYIPIAGQTVGSTKHYLKASSLRNVSATLTLIEAPYLQQQCDFSFCSKLVAASLKMLEEGGRQGNKLETCSEKFRAKGLLKKETELAFVARRLQ